ncbi:hypothetical protein D922_03192 [Enterococcus faecalis 06-MB-DW-09]|nr:hypothetical protein D922_03192 [Enterococcus faecalis 06-MB-DW-09]
MRKIHVFHSFNDTPSIPKNDKNCLLLRSKLLKFLQFAKMKKRRRKEHAIR